MITARSERILRLALLSCGLCLGIAGTLLFVGANDTATDLDLVAVEEPAAAEPEVLSITVDRDDAPATTTVVPQTTPTPQPVDATGGDDVVDNDAPVEPSSIPQSGSGVFVPSNLPDASFGSPPYLEFSVAVEDGIGIDPDELAAFVDETLGDERSWIGDGATGLRRVAEGGTFTLVVATPDTVDELCAPLRTNGIFSCARNGYVALNLLRWHTATEEWPADIETYRRYLVNHEIGHYLLGPAHDSCPGFGAPAPIMMQQTKGLDGCEANGWVYPTAGQ